MNTNDSNAFNNGFDCAFSRVESAASKKKIPGGVLAVFDMAHGRLIKSTGFAQTVPNERPMYDDTWFDLASLTKVIFTTPRILTLAQEGIIDLDTPLVSVLPDLRQYDANAWERRVTFRQCLGHHTPFPAVEPIYTYGSDAELLRAFVLQREWRAGAPVYSDINFILLGLALERLQNKLIRELDPGPGFSFSASPHLAAATENCTWRSRMLCGEVHDDNCAALKGAGHAGLFGTATAILDYAQTLLNGSRLDDPQVAIMRKKLSATRTHGWECAHEGWSGGQSCSADTIGHTGFTGTGLWIDFKTERAWTLLTNHIHPTRHFDSGIMRLRCAVGGYIGNSRSKE